MTYHVTPYCPVGHEYSSDLIDDLATAIEGARRDIESGHYAQVMVWESLADDPYTANTGIDYIAKFENEAPHGQCDACDKRKAV